MNNQDTIRKAVELANGWRIVRTSDIIYVQSPFTGLCRLKELSRGEKDALAAQLVRQVKSPYAVYQYPIGASVVSDDVEDAREIAKIVGPDRTMNTIKVIVDSEVLK